MATIGKRFRLICKRGSGTFADVWKCQDIATGEFVACKRMKQIFPSFAQAENLKEIIALRKLHRHENILNLDDVIYDIDTGKITLVFELMDMNLYELIKSRKNPITDSKIQHYMYQLCKALDFMHRFGLFHRDVKPENILIKGEDLKLGDFGSCKPSNSSPPHTEYISTRWYRPPECLLTNGWYMSKMDIWAAGCVLFELISLQPLFPGTNEVDQMACIHRVLGTENIHKTLQKFSSRKCSHLKFDFPHEDGIGIDCLLPRSSATCRELIKLMCTYDPDERISAQDCLSHHYFKKYRVTKRQDKKQVPTKMMEMAATISPSDGRETSTTTNVSRERVNLQLRPLRKSSIKPKTKMTLLEKNSETCMRTCGIQLLPKINASATSKKIIPKLQKSPLKSQNSLPPIRKRQ